MDLNPEVQGLTSTANYVLHLVIILYNLDSHVIKRVMSPRVRSLNDFLYQNNTLNLI